MSTENNEQTDGGTISLRCEESVTQEVEVRDRHVFRVEAIDESVSVSHGSANHREHTLLPPLWVISNLLSDD